MTRTTLSLALVGMLMLPLLGVGWAGAQQPPAGGIRFYNETNTPIVVQGASLVNGMLRRGQFVPIPPGKMAWDTNVAQGLRYIIIYDATQTSRILYREPPIQFDGKDMWVNIRLHPTQRDRVILVRQPTP